MNKEEKILLEKTLKHIISKPVKKVHVIHATPLPDHEVMCFPPFRITIIIKGKCVNSAAYDGKICEKKLSAGNIIFFRRHAWSENTLKLANTALALVFNQNHIRLVYSEQLKDGGRFDKVIYYHTATPISRAGLHLLESLDALSEERIINQKIIKSLILALLQLVLRNLKHDPVECKQGKSFQTWQLITNYVCENYQRTINRDEVADVFKLAPSYVSQLFKAHSKENFNAFLKRLRIEEAIRLLKTTDMKVAEIGRRCGFQNSAYFTRTFKKTCGASPGRFRFDTLKKLS